MTPTHVKGKNAGKVFLFALSTCVWCMKTKRFLDSLGVEYYYIDVDKLSGPELDKVKQEMERWNPTGGFPTIVINDSKCVVGYKEDEIKKTLKV
jgi:glutaredoxin